MPDHVDFHKKDLKADVLILDAIEFVAGNGDKLINARADTLTAKPGFKKPFQVQRCLIPATGYFEWQRAGAGIIPFRFTMADNRCFDRPAALRQSLFTSFTDMQRHPEKIQGLLAPFFLSSYVAFLYADM